MGNEQNNTRRHPAEVLRRYLTRGETGRLVVRNPLTGTDHAVYIMQGDILAAQSPGEGATLVRMLVNNGIVNVTESKELLAAIEREGHYEELVMERVTEEMFIHLLHERFRQALLDYLSQRQEVRFERLDAVFVDNIQVGHDSFPLLEELEDLRQRIKPLRRHPGEVTLRPGLSMPSGPAEKALLDLCRPATALVDVIRWSPFEEGRTLDTLREMLDSGVVVSDEGIRYDPSDASLLPISEEAPTHTPGWETEAIAAAIGSGIDDFELDTSDFDGYMLGFDGMLGPAAEDVVLGAARLEVAPPSPPEPEPEPEPEPPPRSPLATALRHAAVAEERRAGARREAERGEVGIVTRPVGSDPAADTARALREAELVVFQDYENDLKAEDGAFTLARDLLDLVDLREEALADQVDQPVVPPPKETDSAEVIEAIDAEDVSVSPADKVVALAFAPPRLDRNAILRKLEVCNTVLSRVAAAIDANIGQGNGQECIQLLLDGAPANNALLFRGVSADSAGRFEAEHVCRNLLKRPEPEHRALLNRALLDLIERALSYALEELPEHAMDELLEEIAGYQQRLRS